MEGEREKGHRGKWTVDGRSDVDRRGRMVALVTQNRLASSSIVSFLPVKEGQICF